ncbi:twin-arginine translocase TatA/TatE family subunit [bacterium]|nr:twin-arginine translocase TatA/TatE family subunit [candidate division CSSED10-310 bacterium]
MMGISFTEILVILVVVLIIFGPQKLPELARLLGKGFAEFRRVTNDLKSAIDLNNIESEYHSQKHSRSKPPEDEAESQEAVAIETPIEDVESTSDAPDNEQSDNGSVNPPGKIG